MTSHPLHRLMSHSKTYKPLKWGETQSVDGPVVFLQYTALLIIKRSQPSYGTLFHAYQTIHRNILITEVCYNCLRLPRARVTLVHPAQAGWYRALWRPLCLPIQNSLLFSSKSGLFSYRTNSNLMSNLNFGHSSLSHSFHTMSAPPTISSLWLREDMVQEVSHSMNVHFHFCAQWAGIIPDTEPWLTRSFLDCAFCPFSHCEKGLALALLTR